MRVLIVEEGWHATMPIARCLAAAGMYVTVVTANGTTARCRHDGLDWLSCATFDDARFVGQLDAIVATRRIDLVLPLTEAAMCALWDAEVTRVFPRTEPWQRALVRDKHGLLARLSSSGVAVPRSIAVNPAFDVDVASAELGLPVVVKGATGSGGRRVHIASTRSALADILERATALTESWVVQEYLAGSTFLVGGVFQDGRPLRVYAGEKIEQHPARTGGAICLRSLADPLLVDTGCRAISALRWTGFASVDLMRRTDGSYVVLEINPRLWGSYASAAVAGVDLFTPFATLVGGSVPTASLDFRPGQSCLIFPRYLNAVAHRNLAGLRQAVRDLRGDQGRDWRDPRFVVHILHRLYWMKRRAVRQ